MPQPPGAFGGGPRLDIALHSRRRSLNRRSRLPWRVLGLLVMLAMAMGVGAVATNALGVGDRFEGLVRRVDRLLAGPVPDRSSRPTVIVTEPPLQTPSPTPRATATPPRASGSPAPTPSPTPEPTPPPRVAVDVNLLADPAAVFNHQTDRDWCAVAGTQMVLTIHGKGNTSVGFQREIASRIREWESVSDSRNGNWGPAAMALALDAYGVPGYEVRAYESRAHALRDSARAISETGAPVVLLTWRGAHTWVMTGYRADADPLVFGNAKVTGAYILDPWYPDVSSIWGASDEPGHFEDEAEMRRNYLPWKRPEGTYPDRDGKFIAVVPTIPLGG